MPRIRRARLDDHPALVGLWDEVDGLHADLLPSLFRRTPSPTVAHPRAELERILADRDQALLVADSARPARGPAEGGGGHLDGFVHALLYDTPPRPLLVPRRRAHVDCLVVAAARRRGGLGRRLMDEVAAWAREHGAAELVLTVWAANAAAEAFYEALGYRRLSSVMTREL